MILFGRRRRWIVDRLQHRILLFNLFYFWLVVIGMGIAVFSGPIATLRDELDVGQHFQASQQLLSLHYRFWPAALVICLLFVVHTMILSHRIAGPLYRFRKTLALVRQGDLAVRVKLRAADQLQEDAQVINGLIESLEQQAKRQGLFRQALALQLETLREELDRCELESAKARLAQLLATSVEPSCGTDRASPLDSPRVPAADNAGADQPVVSP